MEEKDDFEIKDVSVDRYNILVLQRDDPEFDKIKDEEGWICIGDYAISCAKIHLQGHLPISMSKITTSNINELKAKKIMALLDLK